MVILILGWSVDVRYLYRKSYPASAIAPYNAAKTNLGLVRKALRIGKNIEHFKAAAIAVQSPLAKVPVQDGGNWI